MKVRSKAEAQQILDEDLIWRKKELTEYRFMLDAASSRGDRGKALLRGSTALLYAHWEGYVRTGGRAYLEYVAYLKLKNGVLAPNFLALACRGLLRSAGAANRLASHVRLVRFFTEDLDKRSDISAKAAFSTLGNLSSVALFEILEVLGLPRSPFESKANLIDEGLLRARNTIAHGEPVLVDRARYEELYREVLYLLETYRTEISNALAGDRYRVEREMGSTLKS